MILFINTSDKEKIYLRLERRAGQKKETVSRLSLTAPRRQSEKLLPAIQKLMGKTRVSLEDLSEIRVAASGGSFTALRIGIATANALAYALKIPVYPIGQEKTIKKSRGLQIVSPAYDREPNIGV